MSVVKTPHVFPKRTSSLALGLSLWTGVVGPILFVLVETIDGAITPGYSAMREAVSYLELGPGGWIQILNFLVTGLLLILFALGFFRWMRPLMASVSRAGAFALLTLTGVGLVMANLFLPDHWPAHLPDRVGKPHLSPIDPASMGRTLQSRCYHYRLCLVCAARHSSAPASKRRGAGSEHDDPPLCHRHCPDL